MKIFKCKKFDVHDQALIENARTTGQPADIANAIHAAVDGFKERLLALPNGFPMVDGRPALMIKTPGCFFDYYVIILVLQEIANATGQVVDLYKTGQAVKRDTPASPDVVFEN